MHFNSLNSRKNVLSSPPTLTPPPLPPTNAKELLTQNFVSEARKQNKKLPAHQCFHGEAPLEIPLMTLQGPRHFHIECPSP